jgi:tetratricopeptide (TPR) repeat protein
MKFAGREIVGDSVVYVGEKAKENGITVPYKVGKKYEMRVSFDYEPDMRRSELYLRFNAKVGKKTLEIPDVKVANGVVATAKLANARNLDGAVTPDKFQRVIQDTQEADIKFLIQQANLRDSELKKDEVKQFTEDVKAAAADEKKEISNIEVAGYASPDGGMDLNTKLAENRQKATANYLAKQLKKAKVEAGVDSKTTAEDWEGFQKLLESSDMQDKELVLRVLNMYSDPEERETQIKNLSAVYKSLADDVLPQLRRARLKLTVDLIGKSDDELRAASKNTPDSLSLEELLYAATLTENLDEKDAIYSVAIKNFPNDVRAYNNLGLVKFAKGDADAALALYKKALEIEPANADINYNAGVAALSKNDFDAAQEYFGKAAGTSSNLGAAMGTMYTMKGDYKNAKSSFAKSVSNNAAIQQILDQDYAGARATLNAIKQPDALTSYLKAIVGARTNDREAVYANLAEAVAADANLKAQAKDDIEFAAFAEDEKFLSIIK